MSDLHNKTTLDDYIFSKAHASQNDYVGCELIFISTKLMMIF